MNDQRKSDSKKPRRTPHLGEDTLLDLIQNLLPVEQKEQALSHLTRCSACEQQLQARVAERERLRASRVLRTLPSGELVAERREDVADAPAMKHGGVGETLSDFWENLLAGFRRPVYPLAVSAVVVAAVLLVVLWPRPGEPPGSSSLTWLRAYTEDIRLRDAVDATPGDLLAGGLEAYADRDLAHAADLLGQVRVSGPLEIIRNIYLGSALAWDGKYGEAVTVLENTPVHAVPDPWRSEAQWTLLVALYESGRTARADSLLQSLAKEPGPAGDRARQFLGD